MISQLIGAFLLLLLIISIFTLEYYKAKIIAFENKKEFRGFYREVIQEIGNRGGNGIGGMHFPVNINESGSDSKELVAARIRYNIWLCLGAILFICLIIYSILMI
jgi:hypothetical protein